MIKFEAKLFKIGSYTILRLPEEASEKLPTRSMVMVSGTLNGIAFKTLLEPDGRYGKKLKPSHWFSPNKKLLDAANARVGEKVKVTLEPTEEWIEPEVPDEVERVFKTSPKAKETWNTITPRARWEWIRWLRAVRTEETRKKHLNIMLEKLNNGIRRPCCFNRNMCSVPEVSRYFSLTL